MGHDSSVSRAEEDSSGLNSAEDMEELRSLPPRPTGLPAASAKRRFAKLGRKTSVGSEHSASSTSRSAEGAFVRQPSKSRIRRHTNRLSGVFLRAPTASSDSMLLTAGLRSSLSAQARKDSMISADALIADDPSELSNQITAPGILKIFGNELCEGAHYKSVLATTHSSAKELVKEALERYGLSKEEAEAYVLCDTIGSIGEKQWRTEGFRVVGDHERPLLLQSLWKPREGLARRFEIQRRSLVEEKTSKDKDTVTAGINAQARKLQKSRSRVTSSLIDGTVGRGNSLWRSKSEMDLLDSDPKTERDTDPDACVKDRSESLNQALLQCYERPKISAEQNHTTETLCPPRPRGEREGEESEREETESSDDNTTQYSIHPPHDCPYLLLLQGCSPTQDFVVYLLTGTEIVIGRQSDQEDASKHDIVLSAADILPTHCHLRRDGAGGPTVLRPCRDAEVTRNGDALSSEVQLSPGDVIGLGQRYLFLFKDPLASMHKEVNGDAPEPGVSAVPWTLTHSTSTSPTAESNLCSACISACTDLHSTGHPFFKSPEGRSLTLSYDTEDVERVVTEIVAMGRAGTEDRPPLTAAFLLCTCVQYSATCLHNSDLRRLLLLIAGGVQSAVWEHTKDLAADQPEVLNGDGSASEGRRPLRLLEVISGLRPLVVWMSNSLELLDFIQYQLPLVLEWRAQKEQGWADSEEREALLELHLSCVRSASEETMAVLEEVIMLAFQQCVYYITKVLYPILPALLDCNPFRKSPDRARVPGRSGLQVPGEIQQVVEVLNETWILLSDCQLHPEISSQLIGYLFYFINASLVNSLMERGSEPGFYQWSRGVQMRANLDLLLNWAHAAGHGELALDHTNTLSSAINLLATPRKNLLQTSWISLRSHYPALSPAQLSHLLSLYGQGSSCRHKWIPSAQDETAVLQTADILESFDTQHPLVLPGGGYQFQLRRPVTDSALSEQLDKLKRVISLLPVERQSRTVQNLPFPSPTSDAPPTSPPASPSRLRAHHLDGSSSRGALILSQKLRNLELQIGEEKSREVSGSALDPSCLLTPPNTPLTELVSLVKAGQDKWTQAESETLPWTCDVDAHEKGGLVFECLAALKGERLKTDCANMKRILELKEEEEQQEEEEKKEEDNLHNEDNGEVFSLELERGEGGLGLALVDTTETSLRVKGIFIRTVVPGSPAARCKKLQPGDRLLAVNGVSLLGLDYRSGKELIQSSGDKLRFLVARCGWKAEVIQTAC